jgi:hypothetical protein
LVLTIIIPERDCIVLMFCNDIFDFSFLFLSHVPYSSLFHRKGRLKCHDTSSAVRDSRRLTLDSTLCPSSTPFFVLLHAVAKTVTLVGFGAAVAGLPSNKRTCNKSCTPHRKDPAYLADGTVG